MVPSPTTSAEPQNCRTPPKHPPVERALEVGPPTVKPPEDVRLRDIVSALPDACRNPTQGQPRRRQAQEHELDPISGILPSPKAAAPQPLLLAGRESRSGKLDPILRKSPRLGTERSELKPGAGRPDPPPAGKREPATVRQPLFRPPLLLDDAIHLGRLGRMDFHADGEHS